MKRRVHDYASAAVGIMLTVGLLALALRHVKLAELWSMLKEAKPGWIAAMAAVSLVDLIIRAARWRLLLSRARPGASAWMLLKLEAIGLAMNNVLFMRLGEFARAFLAGRELDVPAATALASVAVERALDVAALLTLFCIVGSGLPALVDPSFLHGAMLVLGAAVAALAGLAFAEEWLEPGRPWERLLRRWPIVHKLVAQLAAGAAVFRRPSSAAAAVVLSLLLWSVDALAYWSGARALGLGALVDYPKAILTLSWAGAAAAVPTAPGGFGSFELVVQTLLQRLGADAQAALAYAFLTHMGGYVVVTLIGLFFLSRIGFSLGELKAALEREKAR